MDDKFYCYFFYHFILVALEEEKIFSLQKLFVKNCNGFPDFPILICSLLFQTTPPAYEIEKLKMPTAIWSGGHDLLANPKDMDMLIPRFTNLVFYECFPEWEHLDFIWGLDAAKRMYTKIIDLMKKYA